jgi:hypothetical protein
MTVYLDEIEPGRPFIGEDGKTYVKCSNCGKIVCLDGFFNGAHFCC